MNRDFDPMIALLAFTVATCLSFGALVEALILIGLFVPEMVVKKVFPEEG